MCKQVYLLWLPALVAIFASNTSCVSKKKFRAELANRDSLSHFLNVRNLELNREIGQFKLNLAEKTGEGNALREIYDKQVFEIKKLEKEIERLNSQSSSTQQSLNEEVRKRDSQLADKEQLIQNFGIALQKQENGIEAILNEFREAFANLPPVDFYFDHKDYRGSMGISEKQLFRPGTDQLARSANAVIEKIARILNNHPELQVLVIGHSDSQSGYKGFQSRLDFSTRRAVAVADVLTRDFYVNGSQVTAAGRSDFEPRASNETEEGRSQNRRIEIVFQPRLDEVRKMASEVKLD
ncbi:MAG: OmpA family protein [Saprospiraceae bacterium]|nr:OmpA family protein [Saprospiraceae bacterium]